MYPIYDTNWAVSKRGNLWRRFGGIVLTVGRKKTNDRYWARRGEEFIKGDFSSETEAKLAAEHGVDGSDNSSDDNDLRWETL